MTALPPSVRAAVAELTRGIGLGALRQRQAAISANYRTGGNSRSAIAGDDDVAAYLLARLPATFAAVRTVLGELERNAPEFAPRTILDVGCGPGTAMLAALDTYPEITKAVGLDHNARFLKLASRLFFAAGLDQNREVWFQSGDAAQNFPADPAELVLSSYALVECSAAASTAIVRRLWSLTQQALVLVEPGSHAGFERLRSAREVLIGEGAHTLAPCTHRNACPIIDPDWCHFSARLARSREHLAVKNASVPYEDEKFSYLIVARSGDPVASHRILAPPHRVKSGQTFKLCGAEGITHATVSPRDPEFKAAKKWDWGDAI